MKYYDDHIAYVRALLILLLLIFKKVKHKSINWHGRKSYSGRHQRKDWLSWY